MRKLSEETRRKISESRKGKHLSEEAKKKISESNRNRRLSATTRSKISKSKSGKSLSNETKSKISESVIEHNKKVFNNITDIEYWSKYNIISIHDMNRYIKFIKDINNLGDRNLDLIERHHIVPKSFDPSLNKVSGNIISLTPREHFIAHKMLTRCFKGEYNQKMYYAIVRMCNTENSSEYYNITSREYDLLKRNYRKSMSGENNPFYGRKHSEESRRKMSESSKGMKAWNKGKQFSEESKRKMSESHIGKKMPNRSRNSGSPGTIWVTNNEINKRINPNDLQKYINMGFRRGKLYNKKGIDI